MAKKEKKGTKVPKKIGGVKIPKQLRKQGEQLAEFARHPLVADLLTAGLVALAAKMRDGAGKKPADEARPAKPEPTSDLGRSAATVADVIAAKVSAKVTEGAARIIEAAEEGAKRGTRTRATTRKAAPKTTPKTAH